MSATDICPHCGGYVEEDDNENHLIYLKNFLEKERKYQINPNVFSKQTEINTNTFKVLMDWIFLLYKFNFSNASQHYYTCFRAEYIIVQYLDKHDVKRTQLQLVGTTAFWIAYKMESRDLPQIYNKDLVRMCEDFYTKEDFNNMETSIINSVYMLNYSNPLDFLAVEHWKIQMISRYILSTQLYFADAQTLSILPSLLSIVSIDLASELGEEPNPINNTFGYTPEQIQTAKNIVKENLKKIKTSDSVYKYYSTSEFYRVSIHIHNKLFTKTV